MCKTAFIMILFYTGAYAQNSWETYGYAKYLFSITDNALINKKSLTDHQVHLRLNNRWYPSDNFYAGFELRARGFYGGTVESLTPFKSFVISDYPYTDLDAVFWDKKSSFAYAQIDRLFMDYTAGSWQFTLGRQRIAWGTSWVWNIVDLFNPQSVLDFDYEEMPGSDALRIQYYTAAIGRLELAVKPSDNKFDRTAALLWLYNYQDYDIFFIAAWHQNRKLFGTAFAGDIEGAGFRGEFKWTEQISNKRLEGYLLPDFLGQNFSEDESTNISAVLSLDYTFSNSFYLHSEAMYNSIGKTKNLALYTQQAQIAGLLSPAHLSLFFETAYDIHPLVRGNFFVLHNPSDNSAIWVPSLSWSVVTNLDLYVIGLISTGKTSSEFGSYGKSLFFRTKYSF